MEKIPQINERRTLEEEAAIFERGTSKEKLLTLAIAEATDFRDLYKIIQENDGIQGSQKHYSPEELFQLIQRVGKKELDPKFLTSAFGLRQKVQYLLSIKEIK